MRPGEINIFNLKLAGKNWKKAGNSGYLFLSKIRALNKTRMGEKLGGGGKFKKDSPSTYFSPENWVSCSVEN